MLLHCSYKYCLHGGKTKAAAPLMGRVEQVLPHLHYSRTRDPSILPLSFFPAPGQAFFLRGDVPRILY